MHPLLSDGGKSTKISSSTLSNHFKQTEINADLLVQKLNSLQVEFHRLVVGVHQFSYFADDAQLSFYGESA